MPPDPAYAAAFSAGLLDPARAPPRRVKGTPGRYDVYRNNVTASLVDALAAIYPAVQRLVGVDFFRAMARAHVRATPPHSKLLFQYGRDFPAFVAAYEPAQTAPFLADVARLERAWLDAYHAADVAPLGVEALASASPDRLADLTFAPHPATRLVRSRFAAVTIFAANREAAPVTTLDAGGAEDGLVTRPEMDVVVRRLAPGVAAFLDALLAGRPLGQAAAAALDDSGDFDLAAALATLVESGAFASIPVGEQT